MAITILATNLAYAVTQVTGTIWDQSNNTPCAGAYIEVDQQGNSTFTNSLGQFHLHDVTLNGGPDPYHYIQVTKTGFAFYQESDANWIVDTINNHDTNIYEGSIISGFILEYGTGTPLSGVTVTAENNPSHTSYQQAWSLADGSYQVRQPPGEIRLRAEIATHAPSQSLVLTIEDKLVYPNNNASLYLGGTISGTVSYEDTGLPVIGATVNGELTENDTWQFRVSTTTDGSGYYEFNHLFPKPYTVIISAPSGYADGYRHNIEVIDQGSTPFIDFALIAGGDLQGLVNDYLGNPVNNVQVLAIPANGNTANQKSTSTDASGNYSISGIEVGEYAVYLTPKQGQNLQIAQVSGVKILPAAVATRNFTLQAGGKIGGLIVNHLLQPISGAEIQVSLDLQYPFERLFEGINSNGSGLYVVDGLSPYQSYTLSIWPPASNTINAQAVLKHLTVAENVTNIQHIQLSTGSNRSGYLVNESGQPITSGMAVAFNSTIGIGEDFNNNDGNYKIRAIPEDDYLQILIPLNSGNYQPHYTKFHASAGTDSYNNVTMQAGGIIEGIVFDSNGNSAVGVQLIAVKPTQLLASMPFFSKQAYTDFGGYYRLEGLESGNYTVVALPTVEDSGGMSAKTTVIAVITGQKVIQNIQLTADGAKVFGVVRDQFGNRIVNGWVIFWNSNVVAYTTADQWGNYSLMLPPGSYSAQAMFTAMLGSNLAVETSTNIIVTAAPETTYKEFVMQVGGVASGKIIDQLGAPVPLAFVSLYQANTPMPFHIGMTDQNGDYEVSGLHSGLYTILATHESYSLASSQTFVSMGGTIKNQNVVIVAATTIAGTVTTKNNRKLKGARISAYTHNSSNLVNETTTDSVGSFILTSLTSGNYDIKASATGLKSQTMTNLALGDRADFILDPLIGRDEAISYPNPCRGDQVTFLYWLDQDSKVLIRVYNQSGELVWDWEGTGTGNRYNSKQWQVSGVAPGVYLYVISTTDQDNNRRIFKNGRLTVIK